MTTGSPVVVVREITKSYGSVRAVDGVSLEIHAGETVGVAGPNGSGKSTMARIIAGFARAETGRSEICGTPSQEWRQAQGVGYVPEDGTCPWPAATPREILRLRHLDAAPLGETPFIDILGAGALLDRRTGAMSKGQWRLIQCLYAFTVLPRVIVMDEPDSGLDPAAMSRLRTAIQHAATRGCAIVVLSHHLDELALVADRVIFMKHGVIRASALRRELDATRLRETYASAVGDA